MSRIAEALLLDNDEDRLQWFYSLSEKEQEEVKQEVSEMVETIIKIARPLMEACVSFAIAFAENCAKLASTYGEVYWAILEGEGK